MIRGRRRETGGLTPLGVVFTDTVNIHVCDHCLIHARCNIFVLCLTIAGTPHSPTLLTRVMVGILWRRVEPMEIGPHIGS